MKRPIYTRKTKAIAWFTLFTQCFMLFVPQVSVAQTSSDASAETQGPSGQTTQMVDLFTGDFNYSIPLMNVDGFPITLNYNGNVTMHQEASWVGLGWTLNTGAINREMRGIPDDFNGDEITSTEKTKVDESSFSNLGYNTTLNIANSGIGLRFGLGLELKGGPIYNSYQGYGHNFDLLFNYSVGTDVINGKNVAFNGSAGIKFNSLRGIAWNRSQLSASLYVSEDKNPIYGFDLTTSNVSTSNSSRGARTKYRQIGLGGFIPSSGVQLGSGGDISYGSKTFIPIISRSGLGSGSMYRISVGFYGSLNPPASLPSLSVYTVIEDGENTHEYVNNTVTKRAYGYFNAHNGANVSGAITDFNRENWDKVSKEIKVLPVAHITHDIFRMSTPMHSAVFRAYRNDIGATNNYLISDLASSTSNMFEAGAGNFFRASYSHSNTNSYAASQNWNESASASSNLSYKNVNALGSENETYYFKSAGESVKYNSTFFNQYGGTSATAIDITRTGADYDNLAVLKNYNDNSQLTGTSSLPSNNYISGKQPRNTLYATLTAEIASKENGGFETEMLSYGLNVYGSGRNETTEVVDRITNVKKSHHLSEIIVTDPSGERSVFNYPVYTVKEKEVYFNVTGNSVVSSEENLIGYNEDVDNSTSNSRGYEELYHADEIPGYASSFLLRGLLSPDYSDRTGNGMSEDDYGSYIKINYTQVYDESNPFKWRAPISGNATSPVASHFKNVENYDDDEIGYYNYGEKEIWYTHSIEGKNYVAVFYLDERTDMFSTIDENGGLDTDKPGMLLDRIVLYSKEDLETNGANAEPLQTVKFNYDYSLCKYFDGNINGGSGGTISGKLTLLSVYIITSNSKKGSLTKYTFGYDNNPDYHVGKADRWGSYDTDVTGILNNFDFPYAKQDVATANANANAWALTDISLPTGGKIEITYEADDYAYVENRRAMQMIPIKNLSRHVNISNLSGHLSNHLTVGTTPANRKLSNNTLFIDLPEEITATSPSDGKQKFYDAYLSEIFEKYDKQLYYRCRVELANGSGDYEWISGYAKIIDYGMVTDTYTTISTSTNTSTAYIVLEDIEVDFGDNNVPNYGVNPIMHKAWQDLRLHLNRILYPDSNPSVNGVDWSAMLNGINKALNNKEYCRSIDLNESFVRLINPGKNKLGGGSRVQQIVYKDAWDVMSGEDEFSYGETYEYLAEDGTSSGVAAFEPTTGNDENPFRQPIRYYLDHDKFPTDFFYHQTPFGEMAFQAPVVGYSRVVVKNLVRTDVTRNATGYRLYEFFTSKDYPTRNIKTSLEILPLETIPNFLDLVLGNPQYDLVGLSQGFVTQKNDMHGKTKSIKSFNEAGSEISSTEYSYKIGEEVSLLEKDGDIVSSLVSRDMDVLIDAFTTTISTSNYSIGAFASLSAPFTPAAGPIISSSDNEEGFYMTTFNKVIHDYAILDKVTTRHLGAQTTAQNLAYDEKTGQVLVSSVQNQYDKPVYSVSYPAWWNNNAFNPASESYGNYQNDIDISGGDGIFTTTTSSIYSEGDIVYVKDGTNYFKYTVFSIDDNTPPTLDEITLIDDDGAPAADVTDGDLVIIKPAEKNIPFMTMMEYTTLDNPLTGSVLEDPTNGNILSASAVEFSECWQVYSNNNADCTEPGEYDCGLVTGENYNPYHVGTRGNWRVKKGYVFQINRDEEATASTIDLRTAGTYDSFEPFYEEGSPLWIDINQIGHSGYASRAKWINTGEIVRYDDNGNPIETKDILGNYSAVLFGYNNNLRVAPIAAATNAKIKQIAYDGFEDYVYRDDIFTGGFCRLPGHFDFIDDGGATAVTTTEAHSGKYSLRLFEDDTIRVLRTIKTYPESNCSRKTDTEFEGEDQLPLFAPDVNSSQPYVVSVWVKQNISASSPVDAYHDPVLTVRQYNSGATTEVVNHFDCSEETPIIDGWQKISGEFTIDPDAVCIAITLKHSGANSANVYFDDLRIHPFNSSMGTISYDPLVLRKLSQGDDYNFTTFFQYDENGFMSRILQETIKGIVTLTETRSGLKK